MDREALDFRRSAAMAATNADQIGSTESRSTAMAERPVQMRDRLYSRDRSAGQVAGSAPREPMRDQNRNIQTVTIQSILKGAREAIIDFDGAAYRLRITRNHRLILTK